MEVTQVDYLAVMSRVLGRKMLTPYEASKILRLLRQVNNMLRAHGCIGYITIQFHENNTSHISVTSVNTWSDMNDSRDILCSYKNIEEQIKILFANRLLNQ